MNGLSNYLAQDPSHPMHSRIRRAIRDAVEAGALLPGQQLAGIRELAAEFGVNRLTVLKAVHALRQAGLLQTVRGKGVYVARSPRGLEPRAAGVTQVGPFFEGVAEGPAPEAGTESAPGKSGEDAIKQVLDSGFEPGCISFAVGFPPPELIPTETIRLRLGRLLRQGGASHLGYLPTEGSPELIAQIDPLVKSRGLQLNQGDKIVITGGAQQATSLCLDALLRAGQTLAIESPGYLGVIAACRLKGIPMIPVPIDSAGPNPERLEAALRRHEIGALYTVPNFQNPTGVTQSLRRRQQILESCRRRNVFVIEDDIYADLRFGGHRVPPIKSLAGAERVVYLGSFSKALAPGLRIGFVVASGKLAEDLRRFKEVQDISTCALSQAVVADLLKTGFYRRHLVRARRIYRERRDAMLAALESEMPGSVRFTRPKGGLHLWVMSERPLDADRLLASCQREGVAFSPGSLFFCDGRRSSSFRLNYASQPPDEILEGVRRLARCLRKAS